MNIATLKVYGDEAAVADVRDGLPVSPKATGRRATPARPAAPAWTMAFTPRWARTPFRMP